MFALASLAASAFASGPAVSNPLSEADNCNYSEDRFNPYEATPEKLKAHGIAMHPRVSEKALANGGHEYVYHVAGADLTYHVPPDGFNALTASRNADGTWAFYMYDSASAWAISLTDQHTDYNGGTAEVVAERPMNSVTHALYPLVNFGQISFSSIHIGNGGTSFASYKPTSITMANGSTNLAMPDSLNSTGNGFNDYWLRCN